MAMLTLELPPQQTQTAFNLRRWAELLADRELAKVEGRIEPIVTVTSFAKEIWLCAQSGAMSILSPGATRPMRASKIRPQFPKQVELP